MSRLPRRASPMPPMTVVVAATALDIKAESIAGAVAERTDMALVGGRVLTVREVDALIESHSLSGRCCIVLVGPDPATEEPAERYLARSAEYVVLRVTAPLGDGVRLATCQVGLRSVLNALRALTGHADRTPAGTAHRRLKPAAGLGLNQPASGSVCRQTSGIPSPARCSATHRTTTT
jgi:hypothetical protein